MSFEKTYSGDRTIHVHLDKTRLNFSIPFIVELTQFIIDSLPIKRNINNSTLVSPMISADVRRKFIDEKPVVDKNILDIENLSGKIFELY